MTQTLRCYKLKQVLDGVPISELDTFVDPDVASELASYGPISNDNFTAKLFIRNRPAQRPDWAELLKVGFGQIDVPSLRSVAALLVLQTVARDFFALTFGVGGRFLLRDDCWERTWGLRAALNLLYPAGTDSGTGPLLSIDAKRRGETTIRSRLQAGRALQLEAFTVDRLRDILNAATGRPPQSESWGSRISGGDSFLWTPPEFGFLDLGDVCNAIDEAHARTDYRESFAWLDDVQPITDPSLIARLEDAALELIKTGNADAFDVGPPEIIDWQEIHSFRIPGDGPRRISRPDLRSQDIVSTLSESNVLPTLDVVSSRRLKIGALDADTHLVRQWSLWRCLTVELTLASETYVLDEGEFFRVSDNYIRDLDEDLGSLSLAGLELPVARSRQREDDYNRVATEYLGDSAVLMDQKLVHAPGMTSIELCDILLADRRLVHVKKKTGSRDLSHGFAQGRVSAELLQSNTSFRTKAQAVVNDAAGDRAERFALFGPGSINTAEHEVVYAIIGDWPELDLARGLPFFSKVNLRATANDLRTRGFRVAYLPIPVEPG